MKEAIFICSSSRSDWLLFMGGEIQRFFGNKLCRIAQIRERNKTERFCVFLLVFKHWQDRRRLNRIYCDWNIRCRAQRDLNRYQALYSKVKYRVISLMRTLLLLLDENKLQNVKRYKDINVLRQDFRQINT